MYSSFALAVAVVCSTETVLGLRMSQTKTLQQPVVAIFDFGYDPESSNISDFSASRQRQMDFETTDPDYFLDHIRKAGGSTMRRWFEAVCKFEHRDKYCAMVDEGGSLTEKKFDEIFGTESSIAVSVIHLREPVARTQSLVSMNIRQLKDICRKGDFEAHGVGKDACKDLTASGELTRTRGSCTTLPATATSPRNPMWNCWQNMYVKSLVGTDRRHSTVKGQWFKIDKEDLELAKHRLTEFSAVLITEWLGHPVVAEYLSKYVFKLNRTIPFGHDNVHATGGNVRFTSQERARIVSQNVYDKQLYEFAKQLALKRMHHAGFRVTLEQLEKH